MRLMLEEGGKGKKLRKGVIKQEQGMRTSAADVLSI